MAVEAPVARTGLRVSLPSLGKMWSEVRRYPVIPVVVLLVVVVIPAIFAPLIAPHDPMEQDILERLKPPVWATSDRYPEGGTWNNILGTDRQGRDTLSRLIHGARFSLGVSLVALLVGGGLGTILGLTAGYFGRWIDHLIMRLVDVMFSIPLVLLALVLFVVLKPGLGTTILVVALLLWARYARLIRAEVLSIKEQDFVAKARVAGASHFRIIYKHIFPNVMNTLIVMATLQVGNVILLEATLSFLGVGIPRPNPSWGIMVADGREYTMTGEWWMAIIPGLAIMMTVLSMNLLGDWLRDHLDPKLRQV